MNVARLKETVTKQQSILRDNGKQCVDAVGVGNFAKTRKNQYSKPNLNEQRKSRRDKGKEKCGRCLRPMHPKKNCPAKDAKCHKYGKTGHSQRACERKAVGEVTGEIFPNDFFLGEIVVENIEAQPWKLNLEANDFKC